jgi:mono/diheme cytochrome c family protein
MATGCQNNSQISPDAAQKGSELFAAFNCATCHSLSGQTTLYGPPLNNIINKEIIVIRNGISISVLADRKYLLRSIKDPDFEKVKEYSSRTMPLPDMEEEDMKQIVDYLIYINQQ